MAELVFNSVNIRTRNAIFLDLVRGFYEPAEVRGKDVIVPGADGQIERPRRVHRRSITLVGYVSAASGTAFLANMQSLEGAMAGTAYANLVIDDGYLGSGTATYTIGARYLNMTVANLGRGPTFADITIEMESVDPEWVAS